MTYRVIQEFKLSGSPLTQAAADRLRDRLREAAPTSDATLKLGLGRFLLSLVVEAASESAAADAARATAATVVGGRAVRVDVEPVSPAGPGSPASRHAACSGPS